MFLYERTSRTGTMANSTLQEKTMQRKMLQQSSHLNGKFEDTLTLYKMELHYTTCAHTHTDTHTHTIIPLMRKCNLWLWALLT